jgi:hypothetical protein
MTIAGCARGTAASRTANGAAAGALIGSKSANAGKGALIGAGVGAAGGYLYDQHQKEKEREETYPYDRFSNCRIGQLEHLQLVTDLGNNLDAATARSANIQVFWLKGDFDVSSNRLALGLASTPPQEEAKSQTDWTRQ